ncbi:MAG: hypothetical protein JO053_13615 [Acidobacteria bacterium]|nr:hypothetical protein [Acidobacteriota bacterium]
MRDSRWSQLYVSINPKGLIWLSGFTHQAMGEPDAYVIVYDPDMNVLGLQPGRANVTQNAYPAKPRGRHGGQLIRAYRLIREFNLYVPETMWFPRSFIDNSGTLILELHDVKAATTKKRKSKYND